LENYDIKTKDHESPINCPSDQYFDRARCSLRRPSENKNIRGDKFERPMLHHLYFIFMCTIIRLFNTTNTTFIPDGRNLLKLHDRSFSSILFHSILHTPETLDQPLKHDIAGHNACINPGFILDDTLAQHLLWESSRTSGKTNIFSRTLGNIQCPLYLQSVRCKRYINN
jgi:hypothetical protein